MQRKSKPSRSSRKPNFETLCDRRVLAAAYQNSLDDVDVNNDGALTPLDALLVVNHIARNGTGLLPQERNPTDKHFVDVNGDGRALPLDALLVINRIAEMDLVSSHAILSMVSHSLLKD